MFVRTLHCICDGLHLQRFELGSHAAFELVQTLPELQVVYVLLDVLLPHLQCLPHPLVDGGLPSKPLSKTWLYLLLCKLGRVRLVNTLKLGEVLSDVHSDV